MKSNRIKFQVPPKQVKLHGKSQPTTKNHKGYKRVPWLNVSGSWLERCGFTIGSKIELTVQGNYLIIKKV